jgi:hypothetical protein
MAVVSGLAASVGFKDEAVFGTFVAPTRFIEFNDESLKLAQDFHESAGLKAGVVFPRINRAKSKRRMVSGDITFEAADRGLGLLFAQMFGHTPTPVQIDTSGAYRSIFNYGDQRGKSLSIQVLRPRTDNVTPVPFSYTGCKVTSWEFSCSDNEAATWKISIDGRDEGVQSATSPTYIAGTGVFLHADSNQFQVNLAGDEPTLVSSIITLTDPENVGPIVRSVSIKGTVGMASERFGLGNSGLKSEQLENALGDITIDLEMEHSTAQTAVQWYNAFVAANNASMSLRFQRGDAGDGNPFENTFRFPALRILDANPAVAGPDLVTQKVSLKAYDPEISGMTAMQFVQVTNSSTL